MRVVLDTNVLVSALLSAHGPPASIYRAWIQRRFVLLTSASQLKELQRTLKKPALAARIRPHSIGTLVNRLKRRAEVVSALPSIDRSPDPDDNLILAIAEAGRAAYLVSGDRSGLLALVRHRSTRIVSPAGFERILG